MAYTKTTDFAAKDSLPSGNAGKIVKGTEIDNEFDAIEVADGANLKRDGTAAATANIPMGNFKFTSIGSGSARSDSINLGQAQDSAYTYIGSISGVDTITGSLAPALTAYAAGQRFEFVSAGANTGAVTININSLGAKSITKVGTTALSAGDIPSGALVQIVYDGTRFQLTNLAAQSAATLAAGATATTQSPADNSTKIATTAYVDKLQFGQCRLALDSGNLKLSPFNGNRLIINGAVSIVPSAGVTLSPSGLTPSTLYYIYAYMNSGTMTLEASTTAYATDSTTGVVIKSGDATRTLVGLARPVTGPAFASSDAQQFVRSWFNDPGIACKATFSTDRATASTSYTELNSEIRNEFIAWSGETVIADTGGYSSGNGTIDVFTGIALDSTSAIQDRVQALTSGAAGYKVGTNVHLLLKSLTEGYHYTTLLGKVSGGTGTWRGSATTGDRCVLETYSKR